MCTKSESFDDLNNIYGSKYEKSDNMFLNENVINNSDNKKRKATINEESNKRLELQNIVKSYSGISRRGYAPSYPCKKNQDSLIMLEHEESKSLIFACMDGHGEFGDLVSQYMKKRLEALLFDHALFITDIKSAISEVVSNIEKELLDDQELDTKLSGSTMVLAVIRGSHITVANIGDSRIVLGTRDQHNNISAKRLSVDHKPDSPNELKRIIESGGRVSAIEYEDGILGPSRVWLGNMKIPGLAMSRSLCDKVAHLAGVISTPDLFEYHLDNYSDLLLIIATDGLWEFMSDQDSISIASKCDKPADAVTKLISASNEKWLAKEQVVDDTTVCVIFLEAKVLYDKFIFKVP